MDVNEIVDEDSVDRWLKLRPPNDSVFMALRGALRIFPLWVPATEENWAHHGDVAAIPVLRSLLTCGVSTKYSRVELKPALESCAETMDRLTNALRDAVMEAGVYEAKLPQRASADAASAAVYAARFIDDTEVNATSAAAFNTRASDIDALRTSRPVDEFVWNCARADAYTLESGGDPSVTPLWVVGPRDWFADADRRTRAIWSRDPETWSFWLRWWDGMLTGNPVDWELQHDVALIPDDVWKAGPVAVAGAIRAIEAARLPPEPPPPVPVSLELAHTDFSYETARRLMRMVPFAEDISRLRDPQVLQRLQEGTADLQTLLDTLNRAAAASDRQSANAIKVFSDQLNAELERVASHRELRVGVVIDLGETLQEFAADEEIRLGLGPVLPRTLTRVSDRLLDLLRDFLAPAMTRTGPLRTIHLQPNEDPRAIVRLAQQNMQLVADNPGDKVPPLDRDDVEVLRRLVEEMQRAWRSYESAGDPQVKSELGDNFARRAYQLAADKALYAKRALDTVQGAAGGKDNDTADALLRRIELAQTASDIAQFVLELLRLIF